MNPEQTVTDGTIGPITNAVIEVFRRRSAGDERTDLEVALDLLSERIQELENLLSFGLNPKDSKIYLEGMVTPVLTHAKRRAAVMGDFAKDNGYVS